MRDKPRIGTDNESGRIEIYNGNWSPSGERLGTFNQPWTVLTPDNVHTFHTHHEAITHATKEAGKQ